MRQRIRVFMEGGPADGSSYRRVMDSSLCNETCHLTDHAIHSYQAWSLVPEPPNEHVREPHIVLYHRPDQTQLRADRYPIGN